MKLQDIIGAAMITSMCYSHTASAQTPTSTPRSTPGYKRWLPWVAHHRLPLPKEGLVPDRETAIKIAEVVVFRLYGEKEIISERPYQVREEGDIWLIAGTLKEGYLGSVFAVAISKQTGAILHVEH